MLQHEPAFDKVTFSPNQPDASNILALKEIRYNPLMRQPRGGKRQPGESARNARRLRICLRMWDWSEWSRQVFRGVQRVAQLHPHWQLQAVAELPDSQQELSQVLWDGVLTHVHDNSSELRHLMRTRGTKVVSFSAAPARNMRRIPSVCANEHTIARAIGQHLLSGGFRRFAYLTQPRPYPFEDLRAKAAMDFCDSVSCPCEISPQGHSPRTRLRDIIKWVVRLPKPIGIYACSMYGAMALVKACENAGIAIPNDVAIVAWDDDAVLAESISPSLSAAVFPAERLGYTAATLLDRLLRGDTPPKGSILVEPSGTLHVRQSSDVSKIADRDVHLANQFIQEHCGEPLAVKELISAMQVSRSKLEQNFRRVTGKTLNQTIVAAHLQRAKQLLLETRWPLERVAKNAGFGTKQHFHRTFRRAEGTTPAQYRKQFGAV